MGILTVNNVRIAQMTMINKPSFTQSTVQHNTEVITRLIRVAMHKPTFGIHYKIHKCHHE